MHWLPDIISAIRDLGGKARLAHIYREISKKRDDLPKEWEAAVRGTIYQHSSDAKGYMDGNPDVFYKAGHGVWGLRHPQNTIPGRSENALFVQALAETSQDEFKLCVGDAQKMEQIMAEKIAKIKSRFKIT